MRIVRRALALAACASFLFGMPALAAGKIDPFALANEAAEIFTKTQSGAEARAIFSRGLREAEQAGELDGDFAVVYAMYSDLVRFDDNPSYALQLCDAGLALVAASDHVDRSAEFVLRVSRSYALADLGRYQEALEEVRITAIWMGESFGAKSRENLEKEAAGWADKAKSADRDFRLPQVGQLATQFLNKARAAYDAGDTRLALALASRAVVPDSADLGAASRAYVNASSLTIAGAAYMAEQRTGPAMAALRRAIDLLTGNAWDGKSKPVINPIILGEENGRTQVWETFVHLAVCANLVRDRDLVAVALEAARDFASTPDRRFSLTLQEAGIAVGQRDFPAAEAVFRRSVAAAIEAGNEQDRLLAEFYLAVTRLLQAGKAGDIPELIELREAAERAANAHKDQLSTADSVMSTAVRMAYQFRDEAADASPLVERAFSTFLARQQALAGNDAGQESTRREQRSFLEAVIAVSYDADPATANRRKFPASKP